MGLSKSQMRFRYLIGLGLLIGALIAYCIGQGGNKHVVSDGVRDDEVVGQQTIFIIHNDLDDNNNGNGDGDGANGDGNGNDDTCHIDDGGNGISSNSAISRPWRRDERFWHRTGAVGTTLSQGCMLSIIIIIII